MTIYGTICYIMKNGMVLLIRKMKGFGRGKLNAPGGKLREGETPEECVVREVLEETGLRLLKLRRHGAIKFYFGEKDEPDWVVQVFSSNAFSGELKDSAEGPLDWVEIDRLPYEDMWEDDRHWVPLLLEDRNFSGRFCFDESGERLLHYSIKKLNN